MFQGIAFALEAGEEIVRLVREGFCKTGYRCNADSAADNAHLRIARTGSAAGARRHVIGKGKAVSERADNLHFVSGKQGSQLFRAPSLFKDEELELDDLETCLGVDVFFTMVDAYGPPVFDSADGPPEQVKLPGTWPQLFFSRQDGVGFKQVDIFLSFKQLGFMHDAFAIVLQAVP